MWNECQIFPVIRCSQCGDQLNRLLGVDVVQEAYFRNDMCFFCFVRCVNAFNILQHFMQLFFMKRKTLTLKRLVLGLLALVLAYQLCIFFLVLYWKWFNPTETRFMALRLDELQEQHADARLNYVWVPYSQISIHLKRAVVASEDDKFMDHDGFDWGGIQEAMKKNERKGKSVAGGSTITQQLAKNLFLSPSRSYIRKLQEAVITVMIEALWDKRRIFEVYLNVVEWGGGVFGAEAAAQHYYHIHAASISEQQAVRIAVMLPNPREFELKYPGYVAAHAQRVLARMRNSQVP